MCNAFDGEGSFDLWSNTAKTWEGQVHCRRNSTPLPSIRPDDEWWKMRGRGRSKRRKSRGGEKKRHRIREQVWRRSVYLAKGDYHQTRWSKHFCQGCDSWREENTERKKPGEYVRGGIGRQGVWREQIQRECLLKTSGNHQRVERKTLDSAETLRSPCYAACRLVCFISN